MVETSVFEDPTDKRKVGKEEFKAAVDGLRSDLIEAQLQLLEEPDFPVIVLLTGIDFPGRSAAARRLMSWMDPRHVQLYAHFRDRDEERAHPRMWRFWRAMPPKGKIGLFLNGWYDRFVSDYLVGLTDKDQFRENIEQVVRFERMLVEEGALLLKFLLYLPKKESIAILKDITKDKITTLKMSEDDARIAKHLLKRYDYAMDVLQEVLSATSTSFAPWRPLCSTDPRYRDMTVTQTLTEAMRDRMSAGPPAIALGPTDAFENGAAKADLETLDLDQTLDRPEYKKKLNQLQEQIAELTAASKFEKRGLVAVFEGNDAAGKGGCIRRLVAALDPRMIRLIPIAGPNDEERAHPYLWRFWRHIPELGRVAIFDRSWYGRVLVERVEGLCSEPDWQRAYQEIRDFEAELTNHGLIVMKFWLAIDQDEQLRRFTARENTPYKRYKITDEDWRNREKWNDYRLAVRDMVDRTSTSHAPWTAVAANDKLSARVTVLQTVAKRLNSVL